MATFLYRLSPPRPTFPADITPDEGAAMQQHFAYWGQQMAAGRVLVVGPVADPDGTYGIAVLNADSHAAATSICAADPVIAGALGFTWHLYEMPGALVRDGDS